MDVTRGSLDRISRPASGEQTGSVSSASLSHADRICPTSPLSLVVLTNDATDIQDQSSSKENIINSSGRNPAKGQYHSDVIDEENEDSKLQKAIEEMERLDEILAVMICKEKEVKCQGKELKEKLWKELQNNSKGRSECAHEAVNTILFLALEAPSGPREEADFVSVFGTQVPDQEYRDGRHKEQCEKKPDSLRGSFEGGQEETGQEQPEGSHGGAPRGKKKQEDFVKKNIELASGMGRQVPLTQAERERLAELLREMEEEEEDNATGTDSEEDTWAVSIPTGQGYTPEPSDLEQLIDIDSRLHLLLPVEDFPSVQSSYTNLSVSQGYGSEAGWELDGDPQPGEKVLQDIRERRGQERRLQEIQQQLEILGQGQEMTCDSPRLTEHQLQSLLDELLETEGVTPWDPNGDTDAPGLSEALLSALFQDAYTTSFSRLGNGTCKE